MSEEPSSAGSASADVSNRPPPPIGVDVEPSPLLPDAKEDAADDGHVDKKARIEKLPDGATTDAALANTTTTSINDNRNNEPIIDITNLEQMYNAQLINDYVHFHQSYNSTNTSMAAVKKKKGKRSSKNKMDPQILTTRRSIQLCCRDNTLSSALCVFHTALRDKVYLEPQTLYNLLNLCADGSVTGDGEGGGKGGGDGSKMTKKKGRVHVGTPRFPKKGAKDEDGNEYNDGGDAADAKNEKRECNNNETTRSTTTTTSDIKLPTPLRLQHATQIHSLLTKLHIPLTEPAFTALVRLSTRAGDYQRAEMYLDDAERTQQCKGKLRMYSSLLKGYCGIAVDDGDYGNKDEEEGAANKVGPTKEGLVKALKVWKRMYDHSGGPSPGHPTANSGNPNDDDNSNNTTNETTLFGEGISPKITLTEYEYSALMQCATAIHDASVMERVLSDLAERILVPGLSTTEDIMNWFRSDRRGGVTTLTSENHTSSASSALEEVELPPREGGSIGEVSNLNGKGWKIYNNCTIDTSNGKLTLTGDTSDTAQYQLKPVLLTDNAWDEMRRMNQTIVLEGQVEGHVSEFQGGGKGKKRPRGEGSGGGGRGGRGDNRGGNSNKNNSNHKTERWKKFEGFIERHPSFDVVIDGANVGYYQQNFGNAPKHVDYKQIDGLLRHVLEGNSHEHHVILFLHERHFAERLVPSWAWPIIRDWDSDKSPYNRLTVYRTPVGMNDDWYWMHAALMNGGKKDAPPVLTISNDEMRDHHFQMLAHGSFLRWKERHQVRFDFGHWNNRIGRRDVLLEYPSSYSRRIQRLDGGAIAIPLPKKGDEGRFIDGTHVADDGAPMDETYVVIERVV